MAEKSGEWRVGDSVSLCPTGNESDRVTGVITAIDIEGLPREHALALCLATQISAQFWLNFEHNYRAGLAAGKVDVSDGI